MIRLEKTISTFIAATVVVLSVATSLSITPAMATGYSNGIQTNGIQSNGIQANGLWQNGVWQNGVWQNGVWENGSSLEGRTAQDASGTVTISSGTLLRVELPR
jgi:hypothetical protein